MTTPIQGEYLYTHCSKCGLNSVTPQPHSIQDPNNTKITILFLNKGYVGYLSDEGLNIYNEFKTFAKIIKEEGAVRIRIQDHAMPQFFLIKHKCMPQTETEPRDLSIHLPTEIKSNNTPPVLLGTCFINRDRVSFTYEGDKNNLIGNEETLMGTTTTVKLSDKATAVIKADIFGIFFNGKLILPERKKSLQEGFGTYQLFWAKDKNKIQFQKM